MINVLQLTPPPPQGGEVLSSIGIIGSCTYMCTLSGCCIDCSIFHDIVFTIPMDREQRTVLSPSGPIYMKFVTSELVK